MRGGQRHNGGQYRDCGDHDGRALPGQRAEHYVTGVPLSTQVLGKILNTATAGSLVSIELYGPGHYGAAVQVSDGGTGQASYTKGDLLTTPGGAVLSRLAVGSDGQTLTADAAPPRGVKWAGSNRRTCTIDNDSQSTTPLSATQITGRCEIPFAAHIVEVGVWGGTGTGTQTYTGGQFGSADEAASQWRGHCGGPQWGAGDTGLQRQFQQGLRGFAALSGDVRQWPALQQFDIAGGRAAVAVNAGDIIYVSSATPDAVQTWFTITITYTAD